MPVVNYIFVDFENVQKVDLSEFGDAVVKVTLFLGAKQKRLDTTLVEQLVLRAEHVHLVRLTSSGKNALDFTLSYYLGRSICGDPTGSFHVVSKDTGFDPLIEHLNRQQVKAARHDQFAAAIAHIVGGPSRKTPAKETKPAIHTTVAAPLAETDATAPSISVEHVWEHVRRKPANQPKTRLKLHALLKNHFRLDESEANRLISELERNTLIVVDSKGKVLYPSLAG